MKLEDFKTSLKDTNPPAGSSILLQALWHDAKGDWHRAHELAQDVNTADGSWVHAYLHRKEGDLSNAGYWYAKAGKGGSRLSLDAEWEEIADYLLRIG